MPPATSCRLVFPIINKAVTTFKGPTWSLSPNVSVQSISDEDLGVIHKSVPSEFTGLMPRNPKAIIVSDIDLGVANANGEVLGSLGSFVFNCFRQEHPICVSFGIQIKRSNKSYFERTILLPAMSDINSFKNNNYKVASDRTSALIATFYQAAEKVALLYPSVVMTLNSFNAALYRTSIFDKIVDITIALESMLNGNTELSYRFALYNTLSSERDEAKRGETFKLLKTLYNARSNIVHGSALDSKNYNKMIKPVEEKWSDIVDIAQRSIAYYVLFLEANNKQDDWYNHQEQLALGTLSRFI